MNPNLAQELLAASIDDRLAVSCRRRLAAAAAPPAALRQRWGSRLVSLGAFIAHDPHLVDLSELQARREVHRGAHSDRAAFGLFAALAAVSGTDSRDGDDWIVHRTS